MKFAPIFFEIECRDEEWRTRQLSDAKVSEYLKGCDQDSLRRHRGIIEDSATIQPIGYVYNGGFYYLCNLSDLPKVEACAKRILRTVHVQITTQLIEERRQRRAAEMFAVIQEILGYAPMIGRKRKAEQTHGQSKRRKIY